MAEHKTLHLDIISPEKPVFSGEALSVTAKAWDGEVGILPGHAPMVTKLGIGEVRVKTGSPADPKTSRFAVKLGYLEVADNKIVILSEDAQAINDMKGIDPAAIARLEELIANETDPEKKADLQSELEWLKSCDKLLQKV